MCISFLPRVPASQKGAPGLITDGCKPACGCWELNSGPLEEQSVLLTSEPYLQPQDRGSLRSQWGPRSGGCRVLSLTSYMN